MGIVEVKAFFEKEGIESRIQEFEVSSATVELAAQALNCEPNRIAKSLSFTLKKQDKNIIIVVAGNARVDNKKFKAQFDDRAKMIAFDQVGEIIGHAAGGVCPFAVNADVEIYLDVSLKAFETVFPACGSANSAIELSLDELEKYSNALTWVDVC
ncbi:MAG: YbaK/EbsC family protein [Wohlfahrtiimonas sp.]